MLQLHRISGSLARAARPLLFAALALVLLVPRAAATWSIIVVDRITGEVVISSATCLANFNLRKNLAVVVVGKGAGAAQSAIDLSGVNRLKIFEGLIAGDSPQEILDLLAQTDNGHQSKQYGIVSTDPAQAPITFTGNQAGLAATGVTGTFGANDRYTYAIQGNVLTGNAVVFAAESALLGTAGDLGQKTLAAMEAARALGGDGRCSCSAQNPTACGTTPPEPFKSAHTGFLVISRLGDTDGVCTQGGGCANGDYFFERNAQSQVSSLDPVFQLQDAYDVWRAGRIGFADQLLSEVALPADALPADGLSSTLVTVRLVDIDGTPLTAGGATLAVTGPDGAALLGTVGPLADLGDGSYTFAYTAPVLATVPAIERFQIEVTDGADPILLAPFPELRLDAAAGLHSAKDEVSAAAGAQVALTAFGQTLENYWIFASASGTAPGLVLPAGNLPLNLDSVLILTATSPNQPPLFGTLGLIAPNGQAKALIDLQPGVLDVLVGGRLDFAAWRFTAGGIVTEGPVGFDVLP